jgi:hypothetical protein
MPGNVAAGLLCLDRPVTEWMEKVADEQHRR